MRSNPQKMKPRNDQSRLHYLCLLPQKGHHTQTNPVIFSLANTVLIIKLLITPTPSTHTHTHTHTRTHTAHAHTLYPHLKSLPAYSIPQSTPPTVHQTQFQIQLRAYWLNTNQTDPINALKHTQGGPKMIPVALIFTIFTESD